MPQFRKQSILRATAREVFAWHLRPDALESLIPPWEKVRIEKRPESLMDGQQAILVLSVGPFKVRWVAEHTGFKDLGENGGEFTDFQVTGPFKAWRHRHIVRPDGRDRAVLEDIVEYELPMGFLGSTFGGAITRHKLQRMFDFRHDATRKALE